MPRRSSNEAMAWVDLLRASSLWFASLFLEIHSLDVGSYVLVEQGAASCQHTYASLAIVVVVVVVGLVFGRIWYRHRRS